jgi:hypothetical protein
VPDRAVYKSRAAEYLDRLFAGQPDELRAVYEHVVDNLASIRREGLLETTNRLVEYEELPEDIGVEHFERFWLSDSGPMAGQHAGRVLRCAYEEAIRIARSRENPLPIETFWVTGATQGLEVHICEGEQHVTVTVLIPVVREYGSDRAESKSWVVRVAQDEHESGATRLDGGDPPVVAIQTSGARSSLAG